MSIRMVVATAGEEEVEKKEDDLASRPAPDFDDGTDVEGEGRGSSNEEEKGGGRRGGKRTDRIIGKGREGRRRVREGWVRA